MGKVRATRHNGRKGKDGIFRAGHNDRTFDVDNAEHIDVGRCSMNAGKISYVQYVENGSVFFTETALQEYVARCTHRAVPQKENMMTYRKRRA